MESCGRRLMTPDDLKTFKGNHVKLSVDSGDIGIAAATDIARKKVKELSDDPMLFSWYCTKTGKYYPKTECGRSDRPPWITFAESRGADIATFMHYLMVMVWLLQFLKSSDGMDIQCSFT